MMDGRIKWLAVLLVTVWNVAACGERTGESLPTDPHESTKAIPRIPYSEATKISFTERFGNYSDGRYQVDITATKESIQFRCIKGDALREDEEEIIEREFECGQGDWDDLIAVFDDNHVNTWKEQGDYLNQSYGQPGIFEEWPEVDFVSEGDFFNITDGNLACPEAKPPYFYGIDQNEKKFRSDYRGSLEIYTNNDETPYLLAYESYGVPKEYNRFRKDFWDLIVGNTGIPDWRLELGDWGRENLYKKCPYMMQEEQEKQIRYFSLLENYGCEENSSTSAVSLVYDGGEQSILYEYDFQGKIYSVGKSRQPVLYSERKPAVTGGISMVDEVPEIPEGLSEIIERYGVGSWGTKTGGTGYVRQGEFYNIENAKKVEDKNEQALRSGYGALIHVVYTDGDHVEVQLENGQLPEAYNDFRNELWDYMIPYMNKGRGEGEQIPDWRDMIDQWGEENLRSKYPYIR